MATNRSVKGTFHYNNIEKKNKNFMYKNLQRSNCYNSDFSGSNFNCANFRGAHFKLCDFSNCTFVYAEFIGSNLKGSFFQNAVFENAVFDSVNLGGVNFKDAKFKNTIFLSSDTSKCKYLNLKNLDIKVFHEMPKIEISEELTLAIENLMKNDYVKKARIFDTKDGELNLLNLMILLDNFEEKELIKGLNTIESKFDRPFYTLSYIIKLLEKQKIS